ncbi:hypothetical protein WJ969_06170 [Achromobacter xylosoxidans]
MMYLLWSLPALVVIGAIASGRLNTTLAAVLGLLAAIAVALFAAPGAFGAGALGQALSRGLWIGGVITPYILGGLLFWQMAARDATPAGAASGADAAGAPADPWRAAACCSLPVFWWGRSPNRPPASALACWAPCC